jgi:hypothetical protein
MLPFLSLMLVYLPKKFSFKDNDRVMLLKIGIALLWLPFHAASFLQKHGIDSFVVL